MESPTDAKPLVDRFGRFVASRFEELGGRIEFQPQDHFGDHLRVSFGGPSDGRILLLGHLDTVWPPGEIRRRPFAVNGNIASGPGIFDMKAGIWLMWMALSALRQLRGGPIRPVGILLTSDEEMGSESSRSLIEAEARCSSTVFVLEPSLPGGALKTARKGVGRFTVRAIGRAAHAGVEPTKGVNAVEEMAHQVLQLQHMSDPSSGTTVTVGRIQGGTRANVVPAGAEVEVDVRVSSREAGERVSAAIHSLSPVVGGARLEVAGGINRPPMERNPDTARLFAEARRVASAMDKSLEEGSTGGASDGNLTAALEIPTLDGLGAVGDGAHRVTEHVEIDQLPWRAALVAGLIEQV